MGQLMTTVSKRTRVILMIGAYPRSLINFRGALIRDIVSSGHNISAVAARPDAETEFELNRMGIQYHAIKISRSGMNPVADMITFFGLVRVFLREKPDLVLSYTIKPVIYGGIVARCCGVEHIYSLITGLGSAFEGEGSFRFRIMSMMAECLYRFCLRFSNKVFFQNPDNRDFFIKKGLITAEKSVVVDGSGVDLEDFPYMEPQKRQISSDINLRFSMIARLLKSKGIEEYVGAARLLRDKYPQVEFSLAGFFEPGPRGISPEKVERWQQEGIIRFYGEQPDVRGFLRVCDVYVLPSYYSEGTPRTVLEAMAIGRPVITTDAPGCKETVLGYCKCSDVGKVRERSDSKLFMGLNGILVPIKDAVSLSMAMEFFILNPGEIAKMGKKSRSYAEERYDVNKVNAIMLGEMGLK